MKLTENNKEMMIKILCKKSFCHNLMIDFCVENFIDIMTSEGYRMDFVENQLEELKKRKIIKINKNIIDFTRKGWLYIQKYCY